MTLKTIIPLTAAMLLGGAPAALAQSQGQLEVQQSPVERAAPEDTHHTGEAYSPAEKGVGEQTGAPSGDRLARPADPNYTPPPGPDDKMKGTAERNDTTATNAKPADAPDEDRNEARKSSTLEEMTGGHDRPHSYSTGTGDLEPIKRADDPRNPKPDPRKQD